MGRGQFPPVLPSLVPGERLDRRSAASCQVGPLESVTPEQPQPIVVGPVFLGIANAGNGVAIVDTASATALLHREGDPRPISILSPPALAPGAVGRVKLTRDPIEGPEIVAGDRYEVSIPYRGDGRSSQPRLLHFSARYFPSHWEIEDLSSNA